MFASELKKYLSDSEFKLFKLQLDQKSNILSQRPEDTNLRLPDDEAIKALSEITLSSHLDGGLSNPRFLNILRERSGSDSQQIF